MVYQKVEQRTPLVVIGAGVAGCAAAAEAAKAGVEVALIDENPIEMSMMGLDVPLYFGQRILPTVADRGVMMGARRPVQPRAGGGRRGGRGHPAWHLLLGRVPQHAQRAHAGRPAGRPRRHRAVLDPRLRAPDHRRRRARSRHGLQRLAVRGRHGRGRRALADDPLPGPHRPERGGARLRQPRPQHREDGGRARHHGLRRSGSGVRGAG